MFDTISNAVLEWLIKKKIIDESQYDILDLVLKELMVVSLICTSLFIFGYYFNCLPQVILIAVFLNLLKIFSGCKHLSSLERCFLFSSFYFSVISYLCKATIQYSNILFLIALYLGIMIIEGIPYVRDMNWKNSTYKIGYISVFSILIIADMICILLGYKWISNSINYSILGLVMILEFMKINNKT